MLFNICFNFLFSLFDHSIYILIATRLFKDLKKDALQQNHEQNIYLLIHAIFNYLSDQN